MTEQQLMITALVGVLALVIGGVLGHIFFRREEPATEPHSTDTARFEEREKSFAAQVKKLEDENAGLTSAVETHVVTEIALRSDLATEKANTAGLDKALSREREIAEKENARFTGELSDARSQIATLTQQASEQGNQLAALTQLETAPLKFRVGSRGIGLADAPSRVGRCWRAV